MYIVLTIYWVLQTAIYKITFTPMKNSLLFFCLMAFYLRFLINLSIVLVMYTYQFRPRVIPEISHNVPDDFTPPSSTPNTSAFFLKFSYHRHQNLIRPFLQPWGKFTFVRCWMFFLCRNALLYICFCTGKFVTGEYVGYSRNQTIALVIQNDLEEKRNWVNNISFYNFYNFFMKLSFLFI